MIADARAGSAAVRKGFALALALLSCVEGGPQQSFEWIDSGRAA
jgi:hypothetical protein